MQSYTFDYCQYKKKIHKKSKLSFVFLLILIFFLLVTAIFLWPKNLGYSEFYFVEINAFSTYKDASTLSIELQEKGASGYVYFDGKYRVFASFYQSEKDATSVAENLSEEYNNACIYTLSTMKEINSSKLINSEKNAVVALKDSVFSAIYKISQLILQFDKNEIKTENLKLELKKLNKSVKDAYNEFISLTQHDAKKNISKEYANNINTCFANIVEFDSTNNTSSKLKYELTNVIINYCFFVESF